MQQINLCLTTIFFAVYIIEIEGCTETAICAHGFFPKKNCGTWSCYRDYANIPVEWRGYWGVTNVCEKTWAGSHAVSIHCKEENDWTKERYGAFFIGLFIPENLPWAPGYFRWTDGTPVNYANWAGPGHGSVYQQPHNEVPTERVVDFTYNWHDTISNNPVTTKILCKRNPDRVIRDCPTLPVTPRPKLPIRKPSKLPIKPRTTPSGVILETLPMNDDIPVIIPKTAKPPSPKSCSV